MIREFALDPAVLSTWRDLQLMMESFGISRGRLIATYPKRWKRMVYGNAAGNSPIEKKRFEECLARLDDKMHPGRGRHWDEELKWLSNAESAHLTNPFDAVISTENPNGTASVLIWDELDDLQPLWNSKPTIDIARTSEALSNAITPLLRISRTLFLIDPHFNPARPKWTKPLKSIAMRMADVCTVPVKNIEYHTSLEGSRGSHVEKAWFEEQCRKFITCDLPETVRIRFRCWKQIPGGPELHDRHIITERGGIDCSIGLDDATEQGESGSQRLFLLSSNVYATDCERYLSDHPAFELEHEFTVP